MRGTIAFFKKDWLEIFRSGKIWITAIIFLLFGLMNPAVAKLTPALYEAFADQLAEAGMTINEVEITAFNCWQQFYKNTPMLMIVFVILFAGILTNEYQKGTLMLVITKGMSRSGIYLSKLITVISIWTAGYVLMTGLTWFYAEYYWDNSVMHALLPSTLATWCFGILLSCLILFFSSISSGITGVLCGMGACIFLCIILGFIPGASDYLPTTLADLTTVISGAGSQNLTQNVAVTMLISFAATIAGSLIFEKKKL